jgi:hypothetical protein
VPNDRFLAVADEVRAGKVFEPIIIWGQTIDSPLTILEGHLRATAYCLAADKAPNGIKVIAGFIKKPDDLSAISETE